ncbi:MAG: S41 family peptidase [Fimbriimonadaceae bacterium]
MNALSLLISISLAQTASSVKPAEDYVKSWDAVQSAISARYYARKSKKELMDRLLAKYAPAAKAAKTRESFSEAVNRMIDEFGDSHFDLFTPSDQGYYLMDSLGGGKEELPQFGAWFKKLPDGYTVQMVLNGSSAEKAGLMKGDLITLINGKPFTPVDSLQSQVGKSVKITFRRGASSGEKEVEVKKGPPQDMFLDATRDSARIIEHQGKKIGYVHLWTMASNQMRDALHGLIYGKLKDTDAMILDIRDGFGGRPEGFGDPFFRPDVRLDWKMGDFTNRQLFGYQKPLVLLTNEGSRSAKEVFSYIMKKSKRATLIGSTTAGHVLGTSPGRLNEWSILEIPMVEVFTDGQTLERKGVSPDIALSKEFDEKGEDLYLRRALEFLSKK